MAANPSQFTDDAMSAALSMRHKAPTPEPPPAVDERAICHHASMVLAHLASDDDEAWARAHRSACAALKAGLLEHGTRAMREDVAGSIMLFVRWSAGHILPKYRAPWREVRDVAAVWEAIEVAYWAPDEGEDLPSTRPACVELAELGLQLRLRPRDREASERAQALRRQVQEHAAKVAAVDITAARAAQSVARHFDF